MREINSFPHFGNPVASLQVRILGLAQPRPVGTLQSNPTREEGEGWCHPHPSTVQSLRRPGLISDLAPPGGNLGRVVANDT